MLPGAGEGDTDACQACQACQTGGDPVSDIEGLFPPATPALEVRRRPALNRGRVRPARRSLDVLARPECGPRDLSRQFAAAVEAPPSRWLAPHRNGSLHAAPA